MSKLKKLFSIFFIALCFCSISNATNSYCEISLSTEDKVLNDEAEILIEVDSDYSFKSTEKLIVDLYVSGVEKRAATKTLSIKENQTFNFSDLASSAISKGTELEDKTMTLVAYIKDGEETKFGKKFSGYTYTNTDEEEYCKIEISPTSIALTEDTELEITIDSNCNFKSTEKLIVDLYVSGVEKRAATKTLSIKESQSFNFSDLASSAISKGIELEDKTMTLVAYIKDGEETKFGEKFSGYTYTNTDEEEYCEIEISPTSIALTEDTELEIALDSNCNFKSTEKLLVDLYVSGVEKRSATKTLYIKENQTFNFSDLASSAISKGIELEDKTMTLVAYIKDGEETKFGEKFSGYTYINEKDNEISENNDDVIVEDENLEDYFEEDSAPKIEDEFKEIDGIIKVYSSEYKRNSNEKDDTGKIQRAINDIFANKGGILIIDENLLINGTVNISPVGHYPLEICSAEADAMRYFIPLKDDYSHNEFKYTIRRTEPGIVFKVNYNGSKPTHKGTWSNFKFHNLHFKNDTLKSNQTFEVTNMTGFYQEKSSGAYENIAFYGFGKGIYQPSKDSNGSENYCDFNIFKNIYFELLGDVGIEVHNNDSGKFENIISPNSYKTVKNVIRLIKSPGVSIENVFFGIWTTYNYQVSKDNERAVIYSNLSQAHINNICVEHAYLTPIYAYDSTINCDLLRTKFQVEYFFKNIGSTLKIEDIKAVAFERVGEKDYYIDNSKLSRSIIENWTITNKNTERVEMLHPASPMPNKIYRETMVKVSYDNDKLSIRDIFGNNVERLFNGTIKYDKDQSKLVLGKLNTGDEIKAAFIQKLGLGYEAEVFSLKPLSIQIDSENGSNLLVDNFEIFVKIIY